jgi:hypothetical protein
MRLVRVGEALRLARQLDTECDPWTGALASIVRACAENAAGNRDAAIAALRSAVEQTEATDTLAYAMPVRFRLGELLGGAEGDEMVKAALQEMATQGVRTPERWASFYLPGSWGQRSSQR